MKKKLKQINLHTLIIILVLLTSLCSGLLIGYVIPKNIYYVQTGPSGHFVIDGYSFDDYTSKEIVNLVLQNAEYNYDIDTTLLSCNFSTVIEYFSAARVKFVTESPYFIRHADEYGDDSLHTSVHLKNWSNNYFSIQVTFWKLIVK